MISKYANNVLRGAALLSLLFTAQATGPEAPVNPSAGLDLSPAHLAAVHEEIDRIVAMEPRNYAAIRKAFGDVPEGTFTDFTRAAAINGAFCDRTLPPGADAAALEACMEKRYEDRRVPTAWNVGLSVVAVALLFGVLRRS